MARRVYADIPRFKKAEAAVRAVGLAGRAAREEIDRALAGKCNATEQAALEQVLKDLDAIHGQAQTALHHLYDAFD